MTKQQTLGPLTRETNKELAARKAVKSANRIDVLCGKQILTVTKVDYDNYPTWEPGILLVFTDGTYVLIPSDYPDDITSNLVIEEDNPQQDIQFLVDSGLLSPHEQDVLLEDIRLATEKHINDQVFRKVSGISDKLTKSEKKALLKKLQEDLND